MPAYDAFISYSHAKDKPIASALQSVIQKLGKPWYRRRALRVFRDDTSLSATPGLWPAIEQALGQSRYFILLASPEAAVSKWVNKEVTHWLDHNSIDTLLIGVTDGELAWDETTGDFVARENMPLPPALAGRFVAEPKWIHLRAYRYGADKGDAKFTELAADFAAAISDTPKEDLLSQEVRQQRRALTLAWSAVVSLVLATGAAGWQWRAAVISERYAVSEAARAERNFSAGKSTIDSVMVDLVVGLQEIEGMRVETARRILVRAETAIQKLISRTENDPEFRRTQGAMYGLSSTTYSRLGDMDLALDYARKSVSLYRELVGLNLATRWRGQNVAVELAASLSMLGDLLRVQGDIPGSLEATRESLDIRRTLVANEPDNKRLQSDLSLGLNHFGEALRAQGDLENALVAYREGLDISRALVAQNSTNSEWQRLLSIGLEKIGVVLLARSNFADALVAFQETLDIARELNAKDPDNMEWQSDVAASLEFIGDTLRAQGDVAGATAAYREGLDIRRGLAAKDPSHSKRQTNVVLLLVRLFAIDNLRERLTEALAILMPLKEKGALEPAQQDWIATIEKWIAIKESETALGTQTGMGHFNASSQVTNAPTMMNNKLGVVQLSRCAGPQARRA
jgi:tetratricopeptide (TPR) repeat protein